MIGPVALVAADTQGADTLVQVIVATAGSGVLVAVIQGFFTRRKTKAEVESTGATATKLITDAAASVVTTLQTDNVSLRVEVEKMRRSMKLLERWRDVAEDNFDRHEVWDGKVAAQLRECTGGPVDEPPPLRPNVPHEDAT